MHAHLAVKKVCSCWIAPNLIKFENVAGADWCKHMRKKCNGGVSKALYNIVAGDESVVDCTFTIQALRNKRLPDFFIHMLIGNV